ncbi:hypothetical protein CVT24_003285 [Panaeolus cyanescens]|uniref:Uncharacterized protein n=1 Tax=Panaeolus cyanescens TaxID=181874 RepID=A0A409YRC6_9AGAR|nr:hypothetical protein CVT24_003285 [Panaeolus cyanescens]
MRQTLSSKAKGKQREVTLTPGPDANNEEVTRNLDAQNRSGKYPCDHCGKSVGYKTYLAHRKLPKVRMPTRGPPGSQVAESSIAGPSIAYGLRRKRLLTLTGEHPRKRLKLDDSVHPSPSATQEGDATPPSPAHHQLPNNASDASQHQPDADPTPVSPPPDPPATRRTSARIRLQSAQTARWAKTLHVIQEQQTLAPKHSDDEDVRDDRGDGAHDFEELLWVNREEEEEGQEEDPVSNVYAAAALAVQERAAEASMRRAHDARADALDESDLSILRPYVHKVEKHLTESTFNQLPQTYPRSRHTTLKLTKKRVGFLSGVLTVAKNVLRYTPRGVARKSYDYIPLIPRLQAMSDNKEMAQKIRYRSTYTKKHQPGLIRDVFDGSHYRNLLTQPVRDQDYLHFSDDRDIALVLINYNLPPEVRVRKENIINVGTIPGPKKPQDSFCYPLVQELLDLEVGVKSFDAVDRCRFDQRIVLQRRLEKKYYDHFMRLHTLLNLCLQLEFTELELTTIEQGFCTWVKDYEKLYYMHDPERLSACPLTIHSLLHIAWGIRYAGPVGCYWAFPMERHCNALLPSVRSKCHPYTAIANYVTAVAQINQIRLLFNIKLNLDPPKNVDEEDDSECEDEETQAQGSDGQEDQGTPSSSDDEMSGDSDGSHTNVSESGDSQDDDNEHTSSERSDANIDSDTQSNSDEDGEEGINNSNPEDSESDSESDRSGERTTDSEAGDKDDGDSHSTESEEHDSSDEAEPLQVVTVHDMKDLVPLDDTVLQFDKVKIIDLENGDTVIAVDLVKHGEDNRDASFVKYVQSVDLNARNSRRSRFHDRDLHGQLKRIFLFNVPAAPEFGIEAETVILALIQQAKVTQVNNLDCYKQLGSEEVVDLATINNNTMTGYLLITTHIMYFVLAAFCGYALALVDISLFFCDECAQNERNGIVGYRRHAHGRVPNFIQNVYQRVANVQNPIQHVHAPGLPVQHPSQRVHGPNTRGEGQILRVARVERRSYRQDRLLGGGRDWEGQ